MRQHKKHGILLCGGPSFKVYSYSTGVIRLISGSKPLDVHESQPEFKLIMKYVNLKYQPLNEQDLIRNDFLKLTKEML